MLLSDDRFELEIAPGAYLYFAMKDEKGNPYDVLMVEWEDLLDQESVLMTHMTLTTELEAAYRGFELQLAGGQLDPAVIQAFVANLERPARVN